jgi:transcriptional regulator with XRE-family HTH domain
MKHNSTEYEIFRRCMIAARKKAKLTQVAIAKSLNKPQSFVAKYENGERRLDIVEFLIIVRAIGVDPGDIIRTVEQELFDVSCEEKV